MNLKIRNAWDEMERIRRNQTGKIVNHILIYVVNEAAELTFKTDTKLNLRCRI